MLIGIFDGFFPCAERFYLYILDVMCFAGVSNAIKEASVTAIICYSCKKDQNFTQ